MELESDSNSIRILKIPRTKRGLTEFELKKIFINKMEKSESYLAAPEHRDCYDNLKKSYDLDKDVFFSYDVYLLKHGRKDKDKDEDPFAGSDRGLKKRKTSKDAEPTTCPKNEDSMSSSSKGTKSQPKPSGKSVQSEELVFEVADSDMPQDQEGNSSDNDDEPRKEDASRHDWFKKPTPPQEPTDPDRNIGKTTQQSRADVYSTKRILAVTHVKVMRKHGYGYFEENVVRRADNVLYRFKEGEFPQLRINDIEDMLLLVVQNRLINLLGVDVADFLDTTRPDLRKRHPYTPYKDPQGFIYVDDFKRNRLMRSDELYKFSDGTLTRLLSSLEDITKNIDKEYLPKRRWSTLEKKRAYFMIKDINKLLKERRMMRSLEKFIGERFDTSAGNPVKKILLKLNLLDHRSILTDLKEYVKMVMKSFLKQRSVKVNECQERCIIKAFQDYRIKKGMSMLVQKLQVYEMAKFTRWQNEIMLG
ncbi:hypothetical protein Tco_0307623 [Tanacetum coccineum]